MARKKKEQPPKPKDLLMWVGACHYSIESFVEEAARMGVSKRVSRPPLGVKLGDSLLFLAHDEGKRVECAECNGLGVAGGVAEIRLVERREKEWVTVDPDSKSEEATGLTFRAVKSGEEFARLDREMRKVSKGTQKYVKVPGQPKCERCKGWGKFPDGKVFGFCRVNAVELILDTPEAVREYQEREQKLQREGKVEVTPMVGGEGVEAPRGCGFRQVGGLYLVSGTAEGVFEELHSLAAGLGVNFMLKGPFVELQDPVPYPHHRFFGTKLVNREDILGAE